MDYLRNDIRMQYMISHILLIVGNSPLQHFFQELIRVETNDVFFLYIISFDVLSIVFINLVNY